MALGYLHRACRTRSLYSPFLQNVLIRHDGSMVAPPASQR
jgi:hypothetical protein